jgi:hypothetical protein
MSHSSIHAAALSDIEEEILSLEQKLAEAKAAASYHTAKLSRSDLSSQHQHSGDGDERKQSKTPVTPRAIHAAPNQRFATMRQIDAAAQILKESGQPLKTAAIVQEMVDGGFPQQDVSKLRTSLFTSLTRKPEVFEKVGTGLWGLKATQS